MIENKLLHYETRAAFEQDKPNIANTSIAFIDEGRTIYTWGVEYNSSLVEKEIIDVTEEVEQLEQEWRDALNEKVAYLEGLAAQNHADAIQRARDDIAAATDKINQVRAALASLQESCSTKTDLQVLDGKITAVTNWYNIQDQTLAELSQRLDAEAAKIITEGEYTDIVNRAITAYDHEVDLKLATVREEITHTDEEHLVDTVVGRLMDANEGVLKDYATITYLNQQLEGVPTAADVSQIVETTLNAKNPSWNTIVQRVATVEGTTTNISTQLTSLSATVDGFSAITDSVDDHERRIAQIETHVDDDSSAVTLAAVKQVLDDDTNKEIAAKIFLQASSEGSGITLSADKINLSGDTTALGNFIAGKINADYINALDITAKKLRIVEPSTGNAIDINAINGIKYTNGTTGRNPFVLRMNGSGQIGYHAVTTEENGETVTTYEPAISWDSNGELIINSAIIGGGGSGGSGEGGSTYIENPYDDTWIRTWQTEINGWKSTMNTWKSELQSYNNARSYLTGAGIVFDNSNAGNIVAVTATPTNNGTVPAGVSHTAVGGDLNGQHGYYLKNDGTGELAYGNIKWDDEGNLTVKNVIIDSTTSSAGSEYNVIDFYRWDRIFVPSEIFSSELKVTDFTMSDALSFRIMKNGFVVKDVTVFIPMVPLSEGNYEFGRLPYRSRISNFAYTNRTFVKDYNGNIGYVGGTSDINDININVDGKGFYYFCVNQVDASSIISFLKAMPNTEELPIFNQIFAYDYDSQEDIKYIFSENDSIYIKIPKEITSQATKTSYTTFTVEIYYSNPMSEGLCYIANTEDIPDVVEPSGKVVRDIRTKTRQEIKEALHTVLNNPDFEQEVFENVFLYTDKVEDAKLAALETAKTRGNTIYTDDYINHAVDLTQDCRDLLWAVDVPETRVAYRDALLSEKSNGTYLRGVSRARGGVESVSLNEISRISDRYSQHPTQLELRTESIPYAPDIQISWSDIVSNE